MLTSKCLLMTLAALCSLYAAASASGSSWDSLLQDKDYRRLLMLYYNKLATTEPPAFLSSDPVRPTAVNLPKWIKQRRPEAENLVVPTGALFMSGGAGEGKQQLKPEGTISNKLEVKTDANLPAYCSPPNPCPFGKTAADGCEENIPDTASFNRYYIQRQMQAGYCQCDREHMDAESCPSDEGGEEATRLDEMLDSMLKNQYLSKDQEVNPYSASVGEKRMSLTAKKGSQHVLMKRNAEEEGKAEQNPFLRGDHLHVVAKKSPKIN